MNSKRQRRQARKAIKAQPKPFTHLPEKRRIKLNDAAHKVNQAIASLKEAQACAEHYGDFETIQHFIHELEEFMSNDHDEAGYGPFLRADEGLDDGEIWFTCNACGKDTNSADDCGHGYCGECAFGMGECRICQDEGPSGLSELS